MAFKRSTRPTKPLEETPEEIATVERGADLPQSINEPLNSPDATANYSNAQQKPKDPAKPKKKAKLDPEAPLTKNFTVPANDYILDLIQKAAKAESARTGYKVSGRMLCNKLLKEHLQSIIDS